MPGTFLKVFLAHGTKQRVRTCVQVAKVSLASKKSVSLEPIFASCKAGQLRPTIDWSCAPVGPRSSSPRSSKSFQSKIRHDIHTPQFFFSTLLTLFSAQAIRRRAVSRVANGSWDVLSNFTRLFFLRFVAKRALTSRADVTNTSRKEVLLGHRGFPNDERAKALRPTPTSADPKADSYTWRFFPCHMWQRLDVFAWSTQSVRRGSDLSEGQRGCKHTELCMTSQDWDRNAGSTFSLRGWNRPRNTL